MPKAARIASFEDPVPLGEARLEMKRHDNVSFAPALINGFPGVASKAGCAHEVAPASCSGMVPVCAPGAAPHFVLTRLKIRTDHEGLFKGNPEIELFPLNIDGASTGSTSNRSTLFIFSGRTITDTAGRSRFLPDVNSNNVWYTVSKGAAICPATLGSEWATTLIEDDDTTGVLKIQGSKINKVKIFRPQIEVPRKCLVWLRLLSDRVQPIVLHHRGDRDRLRGPDHLRQQVRLCLRRDVRRRFLLIHAPWASRGPRLL